MLLETHSLTKEYTRKNLPSKPVTVRALDNVDFRIGRCSSLALVGASGSGKSTLARCLGGLEKPSGGAITFRGTDLSRMSSAEIRNYKRKVQIVFQDPAGTINPRFTAASAVSEPLDITAVGSPDERRERATYWMEQVGLRTALAQRPALELSGGERQRLAIARALIVNPEVIIFDESFSALDLPVAGHVLALLRRLREDYGLTCLFIGHNLTLLARFCTEVAVMYQGRIVESGPMQQFLTAPAHPYSRALAGAIPHLPVEWPA